MNFIIIYITNPSEEKAKEVAKHLLEKKLIACANLFPIKSMYWWEGKIADENEIVLLAKTLPEKYKEVKAEVEKIHPYDTPCIVKLSSEANEKYFEWMKKIH